MNGDEEKKNNKKNIDEPVSPPKDPNKLDTLVNEIKQQPSETKDSNKLEKLANEIKQQPSETNEIKQQPSETNEIKQQPSKTQETYEPVEERTFSSLKDTNPFQSVLQKRQQSASRVSAEEINLKRRLEKLEGTRDPITKDLLKDEKGEFVNPGKIHEATIKEGIIRAKLAGYSDINEFMLAEAESRPPKPHLYSSQEEADAAKAQIPFFKHAYKKALQKSESIQGDIDIVKERQEEVAQSRFESLLSGELSKVDTRASTLSREAKTSLLSSLEVSKKPFFDYVENREQKQAELEQARQEVASLSQGVSTPEGRERFIEATNTLESKTQETAKAIALERAQKRGGFDRESQYEKASSLAEEIENRKESKEIREKIAVGKEQGFGSLKDALKELDKTSTTLKESLNKFKEEMNSTQGVTEKTAIALDKANKEQERQQKIVKEFERMGGGGGGWQDKAQKWGAGLQTVGTVAGIVADEERYRQVTSNIQQKQARAGVADIVNQEYFDYRAAAKGDMAALRRVSGMYRRQEAEAEELRESERGIQKTEIAAGGTSFLGGITKRFSKINFKDAAIAGGVGATTGATAGAWIGGATGAGVGSLGAGVGAIPGTVAGTVAGTKIGSAVGFGLGFLGSAVKDFASGGGAEELAATASQTAKTFVDFNKQISQANTYVQGFQAGKTLENTVNAIPDYQRQELSDYGRNMYATLQGFGLGANQTFESFASKKSLDTFANLGFDPTQTQQLIGTAAATMGGAFTNASVDRQQEITQRAAALDQSRVMSAQQYMGNMGQLTQVGGGSKQMEEIMANAVARGVGNAKNISEMVGLVSNISAKTGASTAAGAASLASKTMSNLASIMPGAENEALRRATTESLTNRTNEMISGTGMDWASVVGMAHINTKFAGASQQTRMNIKKNLDLDTLEEFKGLLADDSPESEEKVKNLAKSKGLAGVFYDKEGKYIGNEKAKGVLNKFYEVGEAQMVAGSTVVSTARDQEIMKKHYRGEALTPAEEIIANDTAVLATGVAGAGSGSKGTFSKKPNTKDPIVNIPPLLKRPGGIETQQEVGIIEATTAASGLTNAGKTDVLAGLGQVTKDLAKAMENFRPDEMQKKAVEASEKMTSAFTVATNQFQGEVQKFGTYVDRLLNAPRPPQYNGPVDNRSQQQPLQVPTNQKGPPTSNQK